MKKKEKQYQTIFEINKKYHTEQESLHAKCMKDIKGISTGRDPFPVRVEPKKKNARNKTSTSYCA